MQRQITQLRLDGGEDAINVFSKKTDECMSPRWIGDLAEEALDGIDLDPCGHPKSLIRARRQILLPEDGLLVPREGLRVYTNCPFSKPLPWAQLHGRAAAELFLIRIDTTTRWWRTLWDNSTCVVLLDKRIAFGVVGEDGSVAWDQAAMWGCALFGAGAIKYKVVARHGYVAKRPVKRKPRS